MNRTLIVIAAAAVLIAGFAAGAYWYKNAQTVQRAEVVRQHQGALSRPGSPSLGPLMARAQVTEFFDPACEACRAFYPYVKQITQAHAGKVRLTLRYAAFHNGSDYVVKVLEAVRMQGDEPYWRALEAILDAQSVWADHGRPQPQLVWKFLDGLGIDLERARRDMEDPRIAALLAQDAADIAALRVRQTPTFFVNGQPLRDFSPEGLNAQILDALAP
ncbi:DsbA family protein [Pseudothauera rhizosphaerae]|uniref:Disulfide bond formation protein DsbA n=1 Tax=Pseudothauera rhizosphaerae TaxID=2565932 RepID=A0A4S4AFU4_9RHOO|nr:thioredoxin domain-containing protein [Pseudothauera rhizosphaerae]THF58075.1 disulfide bond formation protein DsbA [Pseudothauera rhizosphaerae]